ncbi:hypothetical protein KDA11_04205 [Candidatus Saccharibacteria bacterium]|nr:hypothetical protein [Candidatus Saccharibacteria bacterium]
MAKLEPYWTRINPNADLEGVTHVNLSNCYSGCLRRIDTNTITNQIEDSLIAPVPRSQIENIGNGNATSYDNWYPHVSSEKYKSVTRIREAAGQEPIATYTKFTDVHEFPSLPVMVRINGDNTSAFEERRPTMNLMKLTPEERTYLLGKYGVDNAPDIRFYQDRPILQTVTFRETKLFDISPNLRDDYKQSEEIAQILSLYKKFAEAKITHLDLSKNEFEKFPKQIFDITSLEHLNLANNKIRYIPVEVLDLPELKVLDLRGNGISALPEFLRRSPKLEVIYLQDNYMVAPVRPNCVSAKKKPKITEVTDIMDTTPDELDPHDVPFKCKGSRDVLAANKIKVHMNMLIVPNLRATEIPWLNSVEGVESLYLSDNRLSEIPEKVRSYTNLQRLYFTHNNLTKIPTWIGELKNLKMLFLESRGMATLANEFGMSPELRCLITTNDGAFFKTADMREALDTYVKILRCVPHPKPFPEEPEISQVTHALISKSLCPHSMDYLIERIPTIMENIAMLRDCRLELSKIYRKQSIYENKDRFIRDFLSDYHIFDDYPSLQAQKDEFLERYCAIDEQVQLICKDDTDLDDVLVELEVVLAFCRNNSIWDGIDAVIRTEFKEYPTLVGALVSPTTLIKATNAYRHLGAFIDEISNWLTFYNSSVTLTTLPDELYDCTNLEVLVLDDCPLTSLSPKIKQLTKLHKLSLVNCGLKEIPDLSDLRALRTLLLPLNYLTKIPGRLSAALRYLELNDNMVTGIPPSTAVSGIYYEMRTLTLAINQLTEMPDLSMFPRLHMLELDENKLTTIPVSAIRNHPTLAHVSATGNPIDAQTKMEIYVPEDEPPTNKKKMRIFKC